MSATLFQQHFPANSAAFEHLVQQQVRAALDEDIGNGDLTAQLIPEQQTAQAHIITRESAVVCGIPWATACFTHIDPQVTLHWQIAEGAQVAAGELLCTLHGKARALLSAERCALNFLQTLSATASQTRQFVDAVAGTHAAILDTRKTLPHLRLAQKYAVGIGGGQNQRLALYDGILIKENHIAAAGSIARVLQQARHICSPDKIQIEVETIDQLHEALQAGASNILLDNFNLGQMTQAVNLAKGRAILEASGGVNLASVKAIAQTGVNRISIGGLTKNVQAIDLSMRIISTNIQA